MITIKELLNKIKWGLENQKEYSLFYIDRITKKLREIRYNDIKDNDAVFITLKDATQIPLHRIVQVKKENKLVWERNAKLQKT
ncbi:MAG: DUF504 domain-containing protein [Nanoarchaeota archaeon]